MTDEHRSTGRAPADLSPELLTEALRILQQGLAAMQMLQQQTAAAHQQFLQTQTHAQQAFLGMLESQHRLIERSAGLPPSTIASPAQPLTMPMAAPMAMPPQIAMPIPMTAWQPAPVLPTLRPSPLAAQPPRAVAAPATPRFAAAAPAPMTETPAATVARSDAVADAMPDAAAFSAVLMKVVSELTGYPADMLEPDMDMEADLGIDSIKRVEILAAVQERVPQMTGINPDYMGSMRTLRQIVEYSIGAPREGALHKGGNGNGKGNGHGRGNGDRGRETAPHGTAPPPDPSPPGHRPNFQADALQRRVLRVRPLPEAPTSPANQTAALEGVWAVTDDGSGLAARVVHHLKRAGRSVRLVAGLSSTDLRLPNRFAALLLIAPPSAAGSRETAADLNHRAFEWARAAAPALQAAAAAGGALLAVVARMDGAFGFRDDSFDPAQGGLAGLAKTAAREWPGVACRAIDLDSAWSDTDAAAAALVRELLAAGPLEVGLDSNGRRAPICVDEPIQPDDLELASGDLVVISGGARGVTALAAAALADAVQPALLLLGRSPAPQPEPDWMLCIADDAELRRALLARERAAGRKPAPADIESELRRRLADREVSRNLQRIGAAASSADYRSADVRDPAAVRAILADAQKRHGPVRALIHGAGVLEDRLIEQKTAEQFSRVFDTKVRGLDALLAAIDPAALRHLLLFSSVSGRFGNRGQADYAMANEVLNKSAQRFARRHPQCRTRSINWGPWDGGMVTAPLKREFARQGVELIAPQDGVAAMLAEMADSATDAVEVVLGASWPEPAAAGEPLPGAPAARTPAKRRTAAFERTIDPQSHPFLRSHMLAGRPVLPLAMMVEWLAHAALHGHPGLRFAGLRDLRVLKGIALDGVSPLRVRGVADRATRGPEGFEIPVDLFGGPDGEIPHARALALLCERLPASPDRAAVDLVDAPFDQSPDELYPNLLFHGPDFHAFSALQGHSSRGAVAAARTAPPPSDWMVAPLRTAWLADPLVMDAGLQLGILWCRQYLSAASLPAHIGDYRQFVDAFPTDGVTVTLEVRSHAPHRMSADLTFRAASSGRIVARAADCTWTVDAALARAFAAPAAVGAAR